MLYFELLGLHDLDRIPPNFKECENHRVFKSLILNDLNII